MSETTPHYSYNAELRTTERTGGYNCPPEPATTIAKGTLTRGRTLEEDAA
jgi:hypothetical protein